MTQEKNTILTPEEQAQLAENLPMLLQALESGSPAGAAWLAQWRGKRALGDEATDQAEAIRQEVAAAPPEQGSTAQWCGFPTDMTRCSPFFPMNPKDLGQREFLRDFVITSANWGEIKYTGPKLSTYEEDALLVLLAILDGQSQHRQLAEVEGRKTYTYKGPALPLLRIMHANKKPNSSYYKRLISALKLMMSSVLELSISSGKTKSGKKRAPKQVHMVNMLSSVRWDEQKKELSATINPFFYETYMAGNVTLIDVSKRVALKGVITKALYRFVQSQRQNPVFVGHYLTLADALNMDRDQPTKNTRRFLKAAIQELIRHGVLMKKSGFVEQDIVRLERASIALPSKK